jgi:type III pantothenate kinase
VPTADIAKRLGPVAGETVSRGGATVDSPVAAATVVDDSWGDVVAALVSTGIGTPLRVAPSPQLPLALDYRDPDRLGADRLADALYCVACHPGRNCIIIDAGTAVTVDIVTADGRFAGGAILPGPGTQLQSLHASTFALPEIPLDSVPALVPGLSPEECISFGVLAGVAGAIERIVDECRTQEEWLVVATGGAWPAIARATKLDHTHVEDATLLGVAAFGAYVQGWLPSA